MAGKCASGTSNEIDLALWITCRACAADPTVCSTSPEAAAVLAVPSACCAEARLPAAFTTDPMVLSAA